MCHRTNRLNLIGDSPEYITLYFLRLTCSDHFASKLNLAYDFVRNQSEIIVINFFVRWWLNGDEKGECQMKIVYKTSDMSYSPCIFSSLSFY